MTRTLATIWGTAMEMIDFFLPKVSTMQPKIAVPTTPPMHRIEAMREIWPADMTPMGLCSVWKRRVFGAAHPTEMPKARV